MLGLRGGRGYGRLRVACVEGTVYGMFLLVSGLDSYRSLERARFFENAYRQKYDPAGSSIERLTSGKEAIDPLLSICVSGSLFSTRRFIRADGLISSCPKAKRDALIKALSHDAEMTIVLCREEGIIKDADLKGFSSLPGFRHESFDALNPSAFLAWARQHATTIGFTDEATIRTIAESSNGDSWAFISELGKVACGGNRIADRSEEVSSYAVIDALVEGRDNRFSLRHRADDDDGVVALSPQQARALLLIEVNATEGIHPFIVQKSRRLRCKKPSRFFERIASVFIWSRSGFSSTEESLDILG